MNDLKWKRIFNEIEEKSGSMEDYYINSKGLSIDEDSGHIVGSGANYLNVEEVFPIDYSLSEIAKDEFFHRMKMPIKYFKDLLEDGYFNLVKNHIDHNCYNMKEKKFLIRTLENEENGRYIRAFLTDKYCIFDDYDLFTILKDKLNDKNMKYEISKFVKNESITSMRITFPELEKNIDSKKKKGDILKAGLLILNSEIGLHSINVYPLVYRVVCDNGLTVWQKDTSQKELFYRRHMGLSYSEMSEFVEVAIDKAIEKSFESMNKLEKTKDIEIELPEFKIEDICDKNRIAKSISKNIIEEYNNSWNGDKSLFAIINSMTRVARELDVEDRIEVEKTASKFLDMVA